MPTSLGNEIAQALPSVTAYPPLGLSLSWLLYKHLIVNIRGEKVMTSSSKLKTSTTSVYLNSSISYNPQSNQTYKILVKFKTSNMSSLFDTTRNFSIYAVNALTLVIFQFTSF
jgi:hypothetical protein